MRCSLQSFYDILKKHIPILSWLPTYSVGDLKGDLIAGFTVGLTVVPQGLALAQLANLPSEYGLYTAFMGSYMYAIFGTCKDLVIGPTSVMALMTAHYVQIGGPAYAALLAFLCGCFQLCLGIFNLGFLVNFMSAPVLSGFTSAAAIITATMQLKGILGLKFKSDGFITTVYNLFLNISYTNLCDLAMGVTSIIFLLLLRKFKDQKFACCGYSKGSRLLQTAWWSLATTRNALAVVLCSIFASAFIGKNLFSPTQEVEAGIPHFQLPQFSYHHFNTETNSTTYKDVTQVFKDLGSGAIVIPFISLLEAVAIAKTFTRSEKLPASKEMIALGMGNLMGSFVSAYPVTGSFSRSVINNTSGVKTPLGGIISGSFVLLALCLFAPVFHYIPKSCLSAIIFSAVIFMIHLEDIPAMWNTNRIELIPFLITFICSFTLGLEYGLLLGTATALSILLRKQNKIKISVSTEKDVNGHTLIHINPDNPIYFPSADQLKGTVSKALYRQSHASKCLVIIHGDKFKGMDYTTATALKNIATGIRKENSQVIFTVNEPTVTNQFKFLEGIAPVYKDTDELKDILASTVDKNEITSVVETEAVESSSADALLTKTFPNKDKFVYEENSTNKISSNIV